MQELNEVSKKIISDANAEKAKIINEAKNQASEIVADATNKADRILSDAKKQAQENYSKVLELENYKSESSIEQSVLKEKIKLVEETIKKAKGQLEDVDGKKVESFLKKAYGQLGIGPGTYLIGSEEKRISPQMVESISGGKLKREDKRKTDFKKGIRIFSGKAQFSISPEEYLETYTDELVMDTAAFLFGKDKD